MPIDRLHPLSLPPALPVADAKVTPAARAPLPSLHQQRESALLGEVMRAALAAHSKPLTQREVVCSPNSNPPLSLQQQLQGMSGHTSAQVTAQLNWARRQLRQLKSARELVKDLDGSPLHAHLLLSEIARQAKDQGNNGDADLAQRHLQELEAEHSDEIKSGLNISHALSQSVKEPELRNTLRQVYYRHLFKTPSLGNLVQAVLHHCGEDHFLMGLRTLQRALADDIASRAHLPQVGKLRTLMECLGRTGQLAYLVHSCSDLAKRMTSKNPAMPVDGLFLVRQLIPLAQQPLSPMDTRLLSEKVNGPSVPLQLTFLTGLRKLLHALPRTIWNDENSRQASLRNVLQVMDELGQGARTTLPGRARRP